MNALNGVQTNILLNNLTLKTKFPIKIRDIYKIEERIPSVLVLLAMKIKKTFNLCVKKML